MSFWFLGTWAVCFGSIDCDCARSIDMAEDKQGDKQRDGQVGRQGAGVLGFSGRNTELLMRVLICGAGFHCMA